ncbi:unnamed protein product [Larinioides sclopetarius]|uniref:Uncharacterized protein n=1 Tax=Larinioides sclopetarius TaxID=280406 RepID=A0AAV2B5M7_9ARAC
MFSKVLAAVALLGLLDNLCCC